MTLPKAEAHFGRKVSQEANQTYTYIEGKASPSSLDSEADRKESRSTYSGLAQV